TVFVFGSEPQILYFAGRKSASRYIFAYPLMTPFPDTHDRQHAVLDELRANAPAFVVTEFVPPSFGASAGTPADLFHELRTLLNRDYRLAGTVPAGGRTSAGLETGADALGRWAAMPFWYDQDFKDWWASLLVWERASHGADAARPPVSEVFESSRP